MEVRLLSSAPTSAGRREPPKNFMKQLIKQFLMPNWRKILIAIILMGLSLFFVHSPTFPGPDELGRMAIVDFYSIGRGLPLPYLIINIGGGMAQGFSIFYLGLVIDLIFWYLISCLIIFIYNKLRSKKV
jgi:hypothetical protein